MDFILKKSKRKTVAIEISPDGTLIVKAPMRYTNKDALQVIKNNEKWINKHLPSILNKHNAVSSLTKEEVKLPPFADDVILYTKKAKKSTHSPQKFRVNKLVQQSFRIQN